MNLIEAIVGAAEIIAAPLLFYLPSLKGTIMSDAFKAALAGLVQIYTDKLAAMQAQLDAAAADKADALAAQDAEATAEVVAATPQ